MNLQREPRIDRAADDVEDVLKRKRVIAARGEELVGVALAPCARVETQEGLRRHASQANPSGFAGTFGALRGRNVSRA